jgi:general secretion pathway protein D
MVDGVKLSGGEIDLVLSLIEMWTGRTVLRPQQLPTPTFTINLNKRVPKSEAILALETLLNLNGIGLVPVGDKFVKVVDLPRVRMEAPQLIEGSTLDMPPSGRIASKLFQLEFQRVTEFLPQINMLLNGNMGGYVVFEKSNAALVTDSISTLQRIETLIKRLDQPLTTGMTPKFYTIHFAKASDLVNKINAIIAGPLQSQLGSATKFSADDRTNQIVLLSDPRQHAFFDDLITKLDVKADPNTRNEVIYLKHATAKDVATLISNLISGTTKSTQTDASIRPGQIVRPNMPGQVPEPTPPPQIAGQPLLGELPGTNEFSGLVNVQADERSNAVVVSGTVDDIRLIQELVEKIDVLLAQVRIEVVIAEVTLADDDDTGIQSLGLEVRGDKLVGFGGAAPGLSVGGSANGSFATITRPGEEGFISGTRDLAGILQITRTQTKRNATILSAPSITTTHNKEGIVIVSTQVPTISGFVSDLSSGNTGNSNIGRTNINQRDIGLTLKVKPLIGNDGSVQLEVSQELSEPAGEVEIDGNAQPIVSRRSTESFVSVRSGEIIVLGGLQRKTTSRQRYRLGPIPIIGDILGGRSKNNERTDLLVFLRPQVLTGDPVVDNSSAKARVDKMGSATDVKRAFEPEAPDASKKEENPKLQRRR